MPTTQRDGVELAATPSTIPPTLRRLVALDLTPTSLRRSERGRGARPPDAGRAGAAPAPARPFGYQPGLDGLRALP